MPTDPRKKDLQTMWQNQPAESFRLSAHSLRSKALERYSRARLEAQMSGAVAMVCAVFFGCMIFVASGLLAPLGWAVLSLWALYAAVYTYKWVWPRDVPADPAISTCLEFYRKELERRRDHLRHRWWRSGLPVMILGMAMVVVGTGSKNAPPDPVINGMPFLLALVVWAGAFIALRKKLGNEDIEKEIEELRTLDIDNKR